MLSALFSRAKTAAIVGTIGFFVSYFPYYSVFDADEV